MPIPFTTEEILTLLPQTPTRIEALAEGHTRVDLHTGPGKDEWSANDVLAHLRSCSDVWGDCIGVLLARDTPTIRAINPRRWIKRTDYPELEFRPSLAVYTKQRAELMEVLIDLTPADWSRTATVTGAGSVLQRTLISFADRLARHERAHLKQLSSILATM